MYINHDHELLKEDAFIIFTLCTEINNKNINLVVLICQIIVDTAYCRYRILEWSFAFVQMKRASSVRTESVYC